ncbi:murein biosynthesis integral membrane protein MurJ [Cellulomonas sp. HZM]|uniref:murein biosynthesis integral membrane protein MurJ n=1 Tax=Cellulomonas sp. HZM TaxID=1454010 RepID=UPI0009E02610|nr:lipid II flippase MurJ [Cellulomonas sp. HZM]
MSATVRRAAGGLAGAAAMIAAVTVLSRVLGLGRWLAQAHAVGDGTIGDAYNAANLLPNVLFETAAGGALAGALIPVLAAPIARRDRREVDATASATLGWTLLVLVPLAALLAALAGPIGHAFGHTPDQAATVRFFVLVFAVQVPMYGVAVLLYAVMQAHKRFFWPAFAPVMSSLVVIATYMVYGALAHGERDDTSALQAGALDVLAWGTTLGVAAMCLPMFVPVHRLGVRLRPSLTFPLGIGARVRALAFAGIAGVAAQQLATVVVLAVASSWGSKGTVTTYLYAQQVYLLPYAVLVVPLATSTFPRLAARAAAGDTAGFARTSAATARGVVGAAVVGASAVAAGAAAVATLFRVLTGNPATLQMGAAVTWMVPGLVGFALLFHVSRCLYALGRGRAAVRANVVGWGVMSIGVVALVGVGVPDGRAVVSIALASSVGMLAGGATAVAALARAAGRDALHGLTRTAVVLGAGAVLGALAGRWLADTVQDLGGDGGWTAVGAAAGGAVVALVVVAAAALVADRGLVGDVVHVERSVPPAARSAAVQEAVTAAPDAASGSDGDPPEPRD